MPPETPELHAPLSLALGKKSCSQGPPFSLDVDARGFPQIQSKAPNPGTGALRVYCLQPGLPASPPVRTGACERTSGFHALISFAVIVYLNVSGSSWSSALPPASPFVYIRYGILG